MINPIKISPDLSLPLEAVTQTFAFLARRGAGKTYGASKLCEEMLDAGAQVIVLDPVGNWYGLRLAADGKGKGISIPVFGGEHGDIPLEPGAGALVADLIVDKRISVVLDVSTMRKNQRKEFATSFAEQFYHRKKTNRTAVHIFIEEAQVFVPQRVGSDEARMLGAFEDLIKLGRNYGIGATLISQRPQSVNKDALNQTEALVVLQTNGAQERKALESWIIEQGLDVKTLVNELPSLPRGTAFFWSPSWIGITKKIRIGKKRTFDASATPITGAAQTKQGTLAPVDLKEIQESMAATVERAKENDPRALKSEIARLKKELAKVPEPVQEVPEPKIVEVEVVSPQNVKRLEEAARQILEQTNDLLQQLSKVSQAKLNGHTPARPLQPVAKPQVQAKPVVRVAAAPTAKRVSDVAISKAHQKVLDAIALFERLGLSPVKRINAAFFAGYTENGHFNNLVGTLKTAGLLDYPVGGFVSLTEEGRAIADPDANPIQSHEDLINTWLTKLSGSESKILRILVERFPEAIPRSELAPLAGYTENGHFNNLVGHLKTLGVASYPMGGYVAATDVLFPAGLR
jgi:hypothetical protein